MGKPSRDKGARVERELVNAHRGMGVTAERVPLSGACGGSYTGDLVVEVPGLGHNISTSWQARCEVKARKDGAGFVTLEKWLGDNDALFLKRNNAEPMVVLPWETWRKLVGGVEEK